MVEQHTWYDFNFLKFSEVWFVAKVWSILENIPCTLEMKVYSSALNGMPWRYQWDASHLMYYLISMCLCVCFFFFFTVFLLYLISSLIALWSEKILDMISVFLNFPSFVLWPSMWTVLENVSRHLKRSIFFWFVMVYVLLSSYIY